MGFSQSVTFVATDTKLRSNEMTYRIHNDDDTDYCDYTADTIEEIKELCKDRIMSKGWSNGWSEKIEEQ